MIGVKNYALNSQEKPTQFKPCEKKTITKTERTIFPVWTEEIFNLFLMLHTSHTLGAKLQC